MCKQKLFGILGLILAYLSCLSCSPDTNVTPSKSAVSSPKGIFGGVEVDNTDPVSLSSVALIEGDGEQICSGTLIAPNMIMSAAHCFTKFSPYYVSFGNEVAQKTFWTDNLSDRTKFPNFREITSYKVHPDYDSSVSGENAEEERPSNDIAIAFIEDGAPEGFSPARVIAPGSALTTDITIAGFGAFPEYDPLDPLPPHLRKVDTFIGTILTQSKMIKDGPNPGKGSCVRDSGGSIYLRTNLSETPILIGNVVSGPLDCSEGIGYNTDLRYYIPWIEAESGQSLTTVSINSNCQNGHLDSGEVCDSSSISCQELDDAYVGGTALCNAQCSGYDESTCEAAPVENRCVESACHAGELPVAIPDNNASGVTSSILVSGDFAPIENVAVSVEITHTYRGDLRVRLVTPSGDERILFDRTGSGADDLSLDLNLDDVDGVNPAGEWKLIVSDHASRDTGSLVDWSLQFTQEAPSTCGNGQLDGLEVCDGGAKSCTSIDSARFSGGVASCNDTCDGYDVTSCTAIVSESSCVDSACVSADTDLAIPDNSSSGVSSIVNVESFTGTVDTVHLIVNIDHTYRGDLYVTLTSPQGTVKVLHNKTGSSADDLNLDETLNDFQGEDPTGDFTLFISDNASRDVGKLLNWSIQLD